MLGLNFSYFNQMIKSVVSTTEASNIKSLVNQQDHDIIQQLNDKFNRELMLAKQCLKEGGLPDYHLHRIEADKRHRKSEQR